MSPRYLLFPAICDQLVGEEDEDLRDQLLQPVPPEDEGAGGDASVLFLSALVQRTQMTTHLRTVIDGTEPIEKQEAKTLEKFRTQAGLLDDAALDEAENKYDLPPFNSSHVEQQTDAQIFSGDGAAINGAFTVAQLYPARQRADDEYFPWIVTASELTLLETLADPQTTKEEVQRLKNQLQQRYDARFEALVAEYQKTYEVDRADAVNRARKMPIPSFVFGVDSLRGKNSKLPAELRQRLQRLQELKRQLTQAKRRFRVMVHQHGAQSEQAQLARRMVLFARRSAEATAQGILLAQIPLQHKSTKQKHIRQVILDDAERAKDQLRETLLAQHTWMMDAENDGLAEARDLAYALGTPNSKSTDLLVFRCIGCLRLCSCVRAVWALSPQKPLCALTCCASVGRLNPEYELRALAMHGWVVDLGKTIRLELDGADNLAHALAFAGSGVTLDHAADAAWPTGAMELHGNLPARLPEHARTLWESTRTREVVYLPRAHGGDLVPQSEVVHFSSFVQGVAAATTTPTPSASVVPPEAQLARLAQHFRLLFTQSDDEQVWMALSLAHVVMRGAEPSWNVFTPLAILQDLMRSLLTSEQAVLFTTAGLAELRQKSRQERSNAIRDLSRLLLAPRPLAADDEARRAAQETERNTLWSYLLLWMQSYGGGDGNGNNDITGVERSLSLHIRTCVSNGTWTLALVRSLPFHTPPRQTQRYMTLARHIHEFYRILYALMKRQAVIELPFTEEEAREYTLRALGQRVIVEKTDLDVLRELLVDPDAGAVLTLQRTKKDKTDKKANALLLRIVMLVLKYDYEHYASPDFRKALDDHLTRLHKRLQDANHPPLLAALRGRGAPSADAGTQSVQRAVAHAHLLHSNELRQLQALLQLVPVSYNATQQLVARRCHSEAPLATREAFQDFLQHIGQFAVTRATEAVDDETRLFNLFEETSVFGRVSADFTADEVPFAVVQRNAEGLMRTVAQAVKGHRRSEEPVIIA